MNARTTARARVARIIFATLALGAMGTLAIAAGPQGPPPPPPPPLEDRIESLDLEDATRERVYAVLDAAEGPRRQSQRALESARRRMRALLADDAATDEAIRAADQELDQLEHRAHQQRLDVLLKVRAVLPEKLRGSLAPPPRGDRRGRPQPGAERCGDGGGRSDRDAPEPLDP